jgi:predicted Zn-dependent protease
MEQTTFQDSRVRLLATQFTPCRLNGEREGKPLIQKYQVAEYPFLAVIGSDGDLQAKSAGYANGDRCAAFLVANLPKGSVTRLKGILAAQPEDVDAQATLGVIYAERNLLAQAAQARAACAAEAAPPRDLAAVDHALGLAYCAQGDDTQALPCLQAAVSEAGNPDEVVHLHFLLADAFSRLHQNGNARAELEAVRHLKGATRDEKKKAKTRELRLPSLPNP